MGNKIYIAVVLFKERLRIIRSYLRQVTYCALTLALVFLVYFIYLKNVIYAMLYSLISYHGSRVKNDGFDSSSFLNLKQFSENLLDQPLTLQSITSSESYLKENNSIFVFPHLFDSFDECRNSY